MCSSSCSLNNLSIATIRMSLISIFLNSTEMGVVLSEHITCGYNLLVLKHFVDIKGLLRLVERKQCCCYKHAKVLQSIETVN